MAKKIKVFIDLYHLQDSISGVRTYTLELLAGIQEFGDKNIEYSFSHNPEGKITSRKPRNRSNKLSKLWSHLSYFFWKQVSLPLQVLWRRPDILICTDFVSPLCPLPCDKITVIHDALFWQYPENYKNSWRKYFTKMIALGFNKKTTLVTTSKHAAKQIQLFVTDKYPIAFVYQNYNQSKNSDASILDTLSIQAKNYLLHVGSFDKRKDLITLVRAFDLLKKRESNLTLKLILAGETKVHGNTSVFEELSTYIMDNKLQDSVLMPGYLSKAQIKSLYSQASAYVFPSKEEGFGIPVLESFSCGLPVITSNNPALLEVGGDATISFEIGNIEKLSKNIEELLYSKKLSKKLIEKGFKRLSFFSRKSFVKDFEKLILPSERQCQSVKIYDARKS